MRYQLWQRDRRKQSRECPWDNRQTGCQCLWMSCQQCPCGVLIHTSPQPTDVSCYLWLCLRGRDIHQECKVYKYIKTFYSSPQPPSLPLTPSENCILRTGREKYRIRINQRWQMQALPYHGITNNAMGYRQGWGQRGVLNAFKYRPVF